MGNYQTKIENLIQYTCSTFENNNAEDVQSNARKVIEAFCKVIILHHYGEHRGDKIISSQDSEWNRRLKVTPIQQRRKYEFVLNMLLKVLIETPHPNKISQSKKIELQRTIELLIFKGNSSAHESSPIVMDSDDTIITQKILAKLLRWLFLEFLEVEIPDELIIYIGRYDIFLSYRHTDMEWVKTLESNLKAQGYTIFRDEYQMIAGEKIKQRLYDAINKSNCGVVIYPKKDDSKWIKEEIEWMRERQRKDVSFKIIPVVMHTSEHLPDENILYTDFVNKSYPIAFNDLICAIKGVTPSKNHIKTEPQLPIPPKEVANKQFVSTLLTELDQERLVVLFSQDFTNITPYYRAIKTKLKSKFGDNFYKISIPSFTKSRKKYFASIAKSCGIETKVKELQDWKDAIEQRLERDEEMLLLITDLENGHDEYNREFATTLRNLHYEYSNLSILLIGRKSLASLVYRDGDLSPLQSVGRQLFFPDREVKIDIKDIVLEFEKAHSHRSYLCALLRQERVKLFSPWLRNELVNQLFWKNLLVRRGEYLVWRSDEIREIGLEVLGCGE